MEGNTMKTRNAKRVAPRRLPRSLLEKMVADLTGRIKEQRSVAEAITKVVAPNGQTLHGEWPMRRVIELALDAHVRGLRDIDGFAEIINRRSAVQS
jgi:hypothetical protein